MSIAVKTADGWQVLGVGGDGDCELVGGVAGWAAIESVTGTASLDDLKAANLAPATATADDECPGTYNIVGDDGVVYRVAVFTNTTGTHSITTSDGLVETLVIGGGGSGGGATDGMGGGPGCGGAGAYLHDITQLNGTTNVTVGDGGFANSSARSCEDGKNSVLGKIVAPGGGRGALTNSNTSTLMPAASGGGGAYVNNSGNQNGSGKTQGLGNDGGPVWNGSRGGGGGGAGTAASNDGKGGDGFKNSITGKEIGFAGGGWYSDAGSPPVDFGGGSKDGPARSNSGGGGHHKQPGGSGIVVVRAPKDAANNPKPDAPVAWGDFTTNGDEQDKGTWGPDAQGRMWKWAEWNVANDYTVNLTGGLYWVLCVGGGDAGYGTNNYVKQGQPGLVNEGYWEFSVNPATQITVGKNSTTTGTSQRGMPSSVGDYGNQGAVSFGQYVWGRGCVSDADNLGYKSSITGSEQQYAPGTFGDDRPGRPGSLEYQTLSRPGCVIIATVTNDESDWNPPGALPGVGGWATITSVWNGSGTKPNRYTYKDGIDWVAFEWTESNSLTMQEGLVEFLVVGSGGRGALAASNCSSGGGGAVNGGFEYSQTSSTYPIIIGKAGGGSKLGDLHAAGGFSAGGSNATIAGKSGNDNPPGPNGRAFGGGAGGSATRVASNADNNMDGSVAGSVGIESSITGVTVSYGAGGGSWETPIGAGPWNPGQGGWGMSGTAWTNPTNGADGVVIVRVPAAQAAGVDPATYNDVTVRSVAKEKAKEAVKSEIKSRRKKK